MAVTKYGYAESSALAATHGDAHIYSVVDEDNILENGMLVVLDEMIDFENYSIKKPEAKDKVVLVLNVPIIYDQSTTMAQADWNYFIPAGTPARAYSIIPTDRFAIADYMVETLAGEGKPAVKGNYVVAKNDGKYKEVASDGFQADQYGFAAKIVDITYKSNLTLYRLVVKQNG